MRLELAPTVTKLGPSAETPGRKGGDSNVVGCLRSFVELSDITGLAVATVAEEAGFEAPRPCIEKTGGVQGRPMVAPGSMRQGRPMVAPGWMDLVAGTTACSATTCWERLAPMQDALPRAGLICRSGWGGLSHSIGVGQNTRSGCGLWLLAGLRCRIGGAFEAGSACRLPRASVLLGLGTLKCPDHGIACNGVS